VRKNKEQLGLGFNWIKELHTKYLLGLNHYPL